MLKHTTWGTPPPSIMQLQVRAAPASPNGLLQHTHHHRFTHTPLTMQRITANACLLHQ
jgi:hypothetical protein